jgi:preprotein translocase subunit SecA
MHKIDEALYFVIEEKNNQVELTDHGIKFFQEILILTFFFQILELKLPLSKRKKKTLKQRKERLFQDFGIKVNVFTLTQL